MQTTGGGATASQAGSAHQLILTSPQGDLPQSNSSESPTIYSRRDLESGNILTTNQRMILERLMGSIY